MKNLCYYGGTFVVVCGGYLIPRDSDANAGLLIASGVLIGIGCALCYAAGRKS